MSFHLTQLLDWKNACASSKNLQEVLNILVCRLHIFFISKEEKFTANMQQTWWERKKYFLPSQNIQNAKALSFQTEDVSYRLIKLDCTTILCSIRNVQWWMTFQANGDPQKLYFCLIFSFFQNCFEDMCSTFLDILISNSNFVILWLKYPAGPVQACDDISYYLMLLCSCSEHIHYWEECIEQI